MRRDEPESFFAQHDLSGDLLKQRQIWLNESPELCLSRSEECEILLKEIVTTGHKWGLLDRRTNPHLGEIGRQWEADILLLHAESFVVAGGCVCFPSSWNLQEATGKTLNEVHGIVPKLNEQIGKKIVRFLKRVPEGQAYLRENWGLTRTNELNYHPTLCRLRLEGPTSLDEVFLRIEHQAFVRLPSGILMGIRIEPVPIPEVIEKAPETALRLAGQLRTMPTEVAEYKSLAAAKTWLPESLLKALGNTT